MSALQSGHPSPRWSLSPHTTRRNADVHKGQVSRTCLHRVCLLLNGELEHTLSGGAHRPLSLSTKPDCCEFISHVSWSHIQSVTFNLSWAHFHRHLTTPALSTPALSTSATWCRTVHSCSVHHCHIVLICPLLQIPSLQHGAELSTPALSTPTNSVFPTLL